MPTIHATTVLLVDDCAEDRHIFISYLRDNKTLLHTFLEAEHAEEGLRLCRQTNIDCIIVDYELPDMSGLEFLERLREDMPLNRPPVIMVTGRGSETVAAAALRAGASDYLIKSNVSARSVYRATYNALEVGHLNRSLAQEMKEREKAETELRESEARYRMLVESVREYAIMMLDPEGKIISWNAGARKLFGFHDYEVLGQPVRRLYPVGAACEQEPELDLYNARNGVAAPTDRWLLRKDGAPFFSAGAISPVLDPFGTLCGYSKVVRDITDSLSKIQHPADFATTCRGLMTRLSVHVTQPLEGLHIKMQHIVASSKNVDFYDLQACLEAMTGVCSGLKRVTDELAAPVRAQNMLAATAGADNSEKSREPH